MIKVFDSVAPSLSEAQDIVGGYVEPVSLANGDLLLVNEEGLLHSLPLNQEATELARRVIVGPALLIKADVRGEDW